MKMLQTLNEKLINEIKQHLKIKLACARQFGNIVGVAANLMWDDEIISSSKV